LFIVLHKITLLIGTFIPTFLTQDTHSPIGLRIADGNEALRLYRLALSAAGNSVTASLAARKNIGMAHLRLADLPFQEKLKSKDIEDHFHQSLSFLTSAYSDGFCQGESWLENIEVSTQSSKWHAFLICIFNADTHSRGREWPSPIFDKFVHNC
jgi:hypothetical protein